MVGCKHPPRGEYKAVWVIFIHPCTHLLLDYDVGDSHERKHHRTSEGISLVSGSLTSKSRLVSASQCNRESGKLTRSVLVNAIFEK